MDYNVDFMLKYIFVSYLSKTLAKTSGHDSEASMCGTCFALVSGGGFPGIEHAGSKGSASPLPGQALTFPTFAETALTAAHQQKCFEQAPGRVVEVRWPPLWGHLPGDQFTLAHRNHGQFSKAKSGT